MNMSNAEQQAQPLPILGTPLLYKVSQDTIGNPVPIQNQTAHTLVVQADNFGGGTVSIEWSMDGFLWNRLTDNNDQPAKFLANALKVGLTFNSLYLRATLAGSKNAQNVSVTIG